MSVTEIVQTTGALSGLLSLTVILLSVKKKLKSYIF